MEPVNNILKETQQISPLVGGIGSLTPYQVPPGYFEGFAEQLMQKIKAADVDTAEELGNLSPLLSSISKQPPFEVPQGYFNELSDQAIVGVKAIEFVNVELENLSPLMSDLKSKTVYEVPADYFDSLAEKILSKVNQQQSAKVVSIGFGKKMMRYAAAAVVVGLMAIGGWLYFNEPKPEVVAGFENKVNQISEDEMVNFLENNEPVPAVETGFNTNEEMDESDMKTMLANVSDEELERFVNDNAEINNTLSN